jgi:GNAT superfamily N-acetyltransferase
VASEPTPSISVRRATPDDLAAAVGLLEAGSLVEGKEDPNDLTPYQAALSEIDRLPGGVLVAEHDGEVVGLCQLIIFRHLQSHGGLCAEVESVHVHPDWRKKGIGQTLMEAAIQQAQEAGCYRVQLTSNLQRPDAHRFYERLGFDSSHAGFKLLLK